MPVPVVFFLACAGVHCKVGRVSQGPNQSLQVDTRVLSDLYISWVESDPNTLHVKFGSGYVSLMPQVKVHGLSQMPITKLSYFEWNWSRMTN